MTETEMYFATQTRLQLLTGSIGPRYWKSFASDDSLIFVAGSDIFSTPLSSLPLAVTPSPIAPASLSLSIFPNPSNGVSTISFRLPQRENISLKLFDERGVKVATYFDGIADPGEVQVPIDVTGLSPGSYIAVLTTREGTAVARVILLPK
jgi:hypothetical protein